MNTEGHPFLNRDQVSSGFLLMKQQFLLTGKTLADFITLVFLCSIQCQTDSCHVCKMTAILILNII